MLVTLLLDILRTREKIFSSITDKDVKFQMSHSAKSMCTMKHEKLCIALNSSDVVFQITSSNVNALQMF